MCLPVEPIHWRTEIGLWIDAANQSLDANLLRESSLSVKHKVDSSCRFAIGEDTVTAAVFHRPLQDSWDEAAHGAVFVCDIRGERVPGRFKLSGAPASRWKAIKHIINTSEFPCRQKVFNRQINAKELPQKKCIISLDDEKSGWWLNIWS